MTTLAALPPSRAVAEQISELTPVTLRLRNVPVRQAYAALARQANVRIGYTWGVPSDDRRVTLNVVHESFWETLIMIGKASGLEIAFVRRSPRLEIGLVPGAYQRNQQTVGAAADGAFIAALSDRTSDQDFRAPLDPTKSVATTLDIKLWAEPKFRGLYWHSITVEELVDDAGRPIECRPIARSTPFKEGKAYLFINLAERPWPRKIGRLVIRSKVVTAIQSDVAEITDLQRSESPTIEAGGFRIESQSVDYPKGRQVTMNLSPLGVELPIWMRLNGSIQLFEPIGVDKLGRRLEMYVFDRDALGLNRRFQMAITVPEKGSNPTSYGPPDRLYMDLPTEIADYDVKLEFTDIKLH